MTPSVVESRRQRDRQARQERILDVARDLAEHDGWDGVTTRRLADAIGYSQPVLYDHFPGGKAQIVNAVAVRGFAELAQQLKGRRGSASARSRIRRMVTSYLDFAFARPALYESMFALPLSAPFAEPETPAELKAAFNAICDGLRALPAPPRDVLVSAEVLWAAMHGLASLEASERLPASSRRRRIDALVALVAAAPA